MSASVMAQGALLCKSRAVTIDEALRSKWRNASQELVSGGAEPETGTGTGGKTQMQQAITGLFPL
jgi:hypothetical protein